MANKTNKPKVKIVRKSRNYPIFPCPVCNVRCLRYRINDRAVKDLSLDVPTIIEITHSVHYCKPCNKYFNAPMEDIAVKGSSFTARVYNLVMARVNEDKLDVDLIKKQMIRDFFLNISVKTIYRWINPPSQKPENPQPKKP